MRNLWLVIILVAALPAWAGGPEDYKTKCQMCHGANGSGDTPAGKKLGAKDLRLPEAQKQSDTQLLATMRDGKNKMPAFKGKLQEQQMQDLVAFLRKLPK